jgi:hypothetical protein
MQVHKNFFFLLATRFQRLPNPGNGRTQLVDGSGIESLFADQALLSFKQLL